MDMLNARAIYGSLSKALKIFAKFKLCVVSHIKFSGIFKFVTVSSAGLVVSQYQLK